MSELDYNKVIGYARMFNEWKQELFPKEEYAYKNGCCFAFAHLLAEKAREKGMLPLKIWCLPRSGKKLEAQFTTENGLGTGKREWEGYHVALAADLQLYKDSKKTERVVFDPILFNAPVLEKDWKKIMNAGGQAYFNVSGCKFGQETKTDTSVYGGSGYWLDKDPAMDLSRHAKMMVGRVDCNSTHFMPRNSALFMEAMKLRRNTADHNKPAAYAAYVVER